MHRIKHKHLQKGHDYLLRLAAAVHHTCSAMNADDGYHNMYILYFKFVLNSTILVLKTIISSLSIFMSVRT